MIISFLEKHIVEAIQTIYGGDPGQLTVKVEKTRKDFMGDFTFIVFDILRLSRKSPEETAREIGNYLIQHAEIVSDFNVIKGFLNIVIHDQFWKDFLKEQNDNNSYGLKESRNEAPYVIEYSSPNTNKPLHLGHIRNNLLGFSIANILKANGHNVIKVNLVNDRGIHICKTMLAYIKYGNDETPESSGIKGDHLAGKYYVIFEERYKEQVQELVKKGMPEEEARLKAPLILEAQEMLRKWETRDRNTLRLWSRINSWVYKGFDATYKNLGVDFDKIYYESETYLSGKELVNDGLNQGIFFKKEDGSVWADLSEYKLDEKLLLRGDGTSVYITQDLGTAWMRFDEYRPLKLIYVVGNEQNYHFEVLKSLLLKLNKSWAQNIHHLSYGMVELPEGKMKSREGTVVDADKLIESMITEAAALSSELGKTGNYDELRANELFRMIALGALKYFILKVDPKKNMLFDPRESIDFNGNTGPFIQYSYARIQSVLRKAREKITLDKDIRYHDIPLHFKEKEILKILYDYPEVIKEAGQELSPALIANYVYELAREFNQYYQEIPIMKAEDTNVALFRLRLASFTGSVIKSAFHLLGIEVPERM